jgi:hypothetical protein
MQLRLIGPHPFAKDNGGQQLTRIGTLFPDQSILYTQAPGVHAWQRLAFIELLNAERSGQDRPPLTSAEEEQLCAGSVDLVFEADHVLIRPDPARIELALAADDLLQLVISKRQVKFLSVADPRLRDAIKQRGEYWRLSSLPKTHDGKRILVLGSKVSISGLAIYFYNRLTGTRWLTYQEFEQLGTLDPPTLRRHLQEIADHGVRFNRLGHPEVDFFGVDQGHFGTKAFSSVTYDQMPEQQLRGHYEDLKQQFRAAVPEVLAKDDLQNKTWTQRMLSTLFLEGNESETEQILSGLSPEFFLQIEWLPGGRFEEGEFLVDSVFDEAASHPADAELQRLCDPRAKEIILNFTRDYGRLDYINVGRLPESLSLGRPQSEGRRGVYLVEFHVRDQEVPVRRFLRLQKWGVWEHLDEGKDLLESILESDEYTDYLLDRRLGCRQLGMNLCRRSVMRRLNEIYAGANERHRGQVIRTTYFERDYVPGIATDKLPVERFSRPGYACQLAALLGHAAASSMIVGRSLTDARPAFDDGDEVVLEAEGGLPVEILVADHSGAFTEYTLPLQSFAEDYARPVNKREGIVPEPIQFAEAYLAAFHDQYTRIQNDYRKRRKAFDNLFRHCKYDPAGSFAFRWECVLRRLDGTEVEDITAAIRRHVRALNQTSLDTERAMLANAHGEARGAPNLRA